MNLFVTIPQCWVEENVREFFSDYSPGRIIIPTNKRDGSARGYAFVEIANFASELVGTLVTTVDGKKTVIRVKPAWPRGSGGKTPEDLLRAVFRENMIWGDPRGIINIGPATIFPTGQWEWREPELDYLQADHDFWKEVARLYSSLPEWFRNCPE